MLAIFRLRRPTPCPFRRTNRRRDGINEGCGNATPTPHVITSGGSRPLEMRRVSPVSLKVARGPATNDNSAWLDIFLFFSQSRRTTGKAERDRAGMFFSSRSSLPPSLFSPLPSLYFPDFSEARNSRCRIFSLARDKSVRSISPLGVIRLLG